MSTKKITLPTHFIDLHLHLDGAITLDIAKVLAKLQNQRFPHPPMPSFLSFLASLLTART